MTEKKQYVLRTCNADGTSRNGFKWPKRGKAEASDWDPTPKCGKGLHGALWGEGDGGLLDWSVRARWQVVRVDSMLVDLGDKVKFQRGYVIFTGTQKGATDKIIELGARGAVIGAFVLSGDKGKSISGDRGTSTSGDHGTSISGDYGKSNSGDYGKSISGDYGKSISGDEGKSISGYRGTSTSGGGGKSTSESNGTSTSESNGTSTSGDYGKSTSGYNGKSISGYNGKSTSGNYGMSTSGDYGKSTSGGYGISTSGDGGTSASGKKGIIQITYRCNKTNRKKIKTGYIGEDGLKPNVAYKLDNNNEFVETRWQRKYMY